MSTSTLKIDAPRAPSKDAAVTDVELRMERYGSRHALMCVFKGARYHVWLHGETFDLVDSVIYKNPPLGAVSHTKGYFNTRRLSTERPLGRWLVHVMREEMQAKGLIAAERDRLQKMQAEIEATHAREALLQRKQETAEDLYTLIRAYHQRFAPQDAELGLRAQALIRKIENGC